MNEPIKVATVEAERAIMDKLYSDDVQLPEDTKFEPGSSLPVVEDWDDDSDE